MKFTKIAACGMIGFSILSPLQAQSAPKSEYDTHGWSLSNGEVVKDPKGNFIRLDLKVDRGNSGMGTTAPVEPGRAYELKIEYRSSNEVSSRDHGSWIYLAFRDGKDQNVGEQFQLFERTSAWQDKVIPLQTPVGTAKLFISIRQQQRKGTLDIKSAELKSAEPDAKAVTTLGPATMAAMERILNPGKKISPQGESSPLDGNIFQPYLKGNVPKIVRDLGTETTDGVSVQKIVFHSMTVGGEAQDIFAIIARPSGKGDFPGVLWLHGGRGCAEATAAIRYAKAGYVCIAPDLPGIGDPKICPNSTGPWRDRWEKIGWLCKPDATANETFDAVVTALQAFDLLSAQPGVLKDRVGVSGISMGGYTTTMISGLLGKRIRAAYSKFGCGFYERGSTWTKTLADLPDDQRAAWLRHFDAGHRASGIRAPYFIAAAARDHFFWPPGVNATVSTIPGIKNQVYAPDENHRLTGIPASENIDLLYLAYWLKGEGQPFPEVKIENCQKLPDGSTRVAFSVKTALPVKTATLYVTAGAESWEKGTWEPITAKPAGENRFIAVIPADKIKPQGAWFVNVSDERPATAGSLVYDMNATGTGSALRPLGVQESTRK
ncbi:MAG: dienelactone hydrolase family protein [Luteolibacter sp.]|nr:dienelactone hydrolase family protein [Luteolibacter sp.]